jgi:hypothetical protein
MSAIITERIKKLMIQNLYDDITDSANNYYIAIGRSEDWDSSDTAPIPSPTEREIRNFRLSAQSAKLVTDWSFVIPRYNWASNTTYYGYDDNTSGHPLNTYYVITDDNTVYICLRQGKTTSGATVPSIVKPTGIDPKPFITADGYVWKFLYTVGTTYANRFLSANYMPVRLQGATDSDSLAVDVEQETIQNAAVAKELAGFQLTSGGSGYVSTPTVTIRGNGSGARATAIVSGGAVTNIILAESGGSIVQGTNYDYADISLSGGGGSGATARVIFAPKAGFGADPRDDLRATAIMFNTKPDGTEGGKFIVDNDFRQLALLKNPTIADSAGLYTASAGSMLRYLRFSAISNPFTPDHTITGATSGAMAYVDKTDSDQVWFHQTEATGFKAFTEGEIVSEADGTGTGTLMSAGYDANTNADSAGDIDLFSGEILYIENRAAVQRSVGQIEDIKIIVQL